MKKRYFSYRIIFDKKNIGSLVSVSDFKGLGLGRGGLGLEWSGLGLGLGLGV